MDFSTAMLKIECKTAVLNRILLLLEVWASSLFYSPDMPLLFFQFSLFQAFMLLPFLPKKSVLQM